MSSAGIDTRVIPKPSGIKRTMYEDGDTWDIIKVILMADTKLGKYMCEFASQFEKSYAGLYEIWHFVHKNIRYVADRPGLEKVKDPRQTWRDGYGDCKSFSLFLASILRCLNIKYKYRFVSYGRNPEPTHVYVVATLNNQEVILDSVHDKFDQEVDYSKKWDRMTKIVYIQGPAPMIATRKAIPSVKQRIADGPRQQAPKREIIPAGLTEGAITLELLWDQINILKAYYGDPDGILQQAQNIIFRARRGHFHYDTSVPTGYIDPRLYDLIKQIQRASSNTRISGTPFKIGSLEYTRPKSYPKNCNEIYTPEIKRLQGELFQLQQRELLKGGGLKGEEYKRYIELFNYIADVKNDFNECQLANEFAELLAKRIDGSAYHVLYEFIQNPNAQPGVVTTKSTLHKIAISNLAKLSNVDRANVNLMVKNGIMRTNTGLKLPSEIGIMPADAIAVLKAAKSSGYSGPGIHEPVTVILAAVTKLVIALTGAITAFAGFMAVMNERKKIQFQSSLAGIATPEFSADPNDWLAGAGGGTGNETGSISQYLPWVLGGAAALIVLPDLFKNKN
ncbi:MAG TPA: transglutaminase-like domain-containing protein [Bacteroidia bacterium]|nr:transglutaminase-like domain-containing protein [Bacteroidia bacterium]